MRHHVPDWSVQAGDAERQWSSRFFHALGARAADYGSGMAGNKKKPMNAPVPSPFEPPVRDLADFHLRWRRYRERALGALDNKALSPEERETLTWLIRMADKVGRADLE
jgi:hypothetical protein